MAKALSAELSAGSTRWKSRRGGRYMAAHTRGGGVPEARGRMVMSARTPRALAPGRVRHVDTRV
eukprot:scaffold1523_cov426-Prasinococcus_capsulatus_cf.AAC.3